MLRPVKEVAAQFEIPGQLAAAEPCGSGHIHDTYLLRAENRGRSARYILQRINTDVLRDPDALMDNLARICAHQRRSLERDCVRDLQRRHLSLVRTRTDATHWVDPEGGHWRCFPFIEGTRSLDQVETEFQAYETARAFGRFVARMADWEGLRLAVTIPDFHDLEVRYAALEAAIRLDVEGRAKSVGFEIEQSARWYDHLRSSIQAADALDLPIRIVHNDCKINNVLLDAETGEGLCAIDLDTVMEGTVVADFGELVRTSSSRAAEDEAGLARMEIDRELLRGIARGYLAGMGAILGARELGVLPLAGPLMAFENAIRFLTDHLSGDVYFRIHRNAQNLDRARTQLRRVELLDAERDILRELIESARREPSGDGGP